MADDGNPSEEHEADKGETESWKRRSTASVKDMKDLQGNNSRSTQSGAETEVDKNKRKSEDIEAWFI